MKWMVIWNLILSAALIATMLISFVNLQNLDAKVQRNMIEVKGELAELHQSQMEIIYYLNQ